MSKFTIINKDAWRWSIIIMQPEFITKKMVKDALAEVEKKKNLSALSKIRFASYIDGLCAQILHTGHLPMKCQLLKIFIIL